MVRAHGFTRLPETVFALAFGPGRGGGRTCNADDERFVGPVWVGSNAVIDEGAVVGLYAAVGSGSRIALGARVENAILLEDVAVDSGAVVSGLVLGKGLRARRNSSVRGPHVQWAPSTLQREATVISPV